MMAILGVQNPEKVEEQMVESVKRSVKRHSFEDDSEATGF